MANFDTRSWLRGAMHAIGTAVTLPLCKNDNFDRHRRCVTSTFCLPRNCDFVVRSHVDSIRNSNAIHGGIARWWGCFGKCRGREALTQLIAVPPSLLVPPRYCFAVNSLDCAIANAPLPVERPEGGHWFPLNSSMKPAAPPLRSRMCVLRHPARRVSTRRAEPGARVSDCAAGELTH